MINRRTLMGTMVTALAFLFPSLGRKARAQSGSSQVRVDVSLCFDSGTLLWVPFRAPGLPAGLRLAGSLTYTASEPD